MSKNLVQCPKAVEQNSACFIDQHNIIENENIEKIVLLLLTDTFLSVYEYHALNCRENEITRIELEEIIHFLKKALKKKGKPDLESREEVYYCNRMD